MEIYNKDNSKKLLELMENDPETKLEIENLIKEMVGIFSKIQNLAKNYAEKHPEKYKELNLFNEVDK